MSTTSSLRWELLQPSGKDGLQIEQLALSLLISHQRPSKTTGPNRLPKIERLFPLNVKSFCAALGVAMQFGFVREKTVPGATDFLRGSLLMPEIYVDPDKRVRLFIQPLISFDTQSGKMIDRPPADYSFYILALFAHAKLHLPDVPGSYFVQPPINLRCVDEARALARSLLMPVPLVMDKYLFDDDAPQRIAQKFGASLSIARERVRELTGQQPRMAKFG